VANSLQRTFKNLGLALCVLGMLASLVSCDPAGSADRIGASLVEGKVAAHVVLCDGQIVTGVRYIADAQPIGRSRFDLLLWSIKSSTGSRESTYSVGEVPDGFVETQALTTPPPDAPLVVEVSLKESLPLSTIFEIEDLREGSVLDVRDDFVSFQEFRDKASATCPE
jgi:hypothetical protein